jgi:hypothetical protein
MDAIRGTNRDARLFDHLNDLGQSDLVDELGRIQRNTEHRGVGSNFSLAEREINLETMDMPLREWVEIVSCIEVFCAICLQIGG